MDWIRCFAYRNKGHRLQSIFSSWAYSTGLYVDSISWMFDNAQYSSQLTFRIRRGHLMIGVSATTSTIKPLHENTHWDEPDVAILVKHIRAANDLRFVAAAAADRVHLHIHILLLVVVKL